MDTDLISKQIRKHRPAGNFFIRVYPRPSVVDKDL
jgi:hypothetical protein